MDSETTKGVVTWTLVRLKLMSATTVRALNVAPRTDNREAKMPANALSVKLNTNVSLTEQLCMVGLIQTVQTGGGHVNQDVAQFFYSALCDKEMLLNNKISFRKTSREKVNISFTVHHCLVISKMTSVPKKVTSFLKIFHCYFLKEESPQQINN